MLRAIIGMGVVAIAGGTIAGAASAQSSASTYSYGTYNPVQAAINRNSMNAAILRQATRGQRQVAVHHGRARPGYRR